MEELLLKDTRPGRLHGVWLIGPDSSLEPIPFREETVAGEHRVYLEREDVDDAESRARTRAGRFGTPRASRPSALADPSGEGLTRVSK
jgi:hypothetical protein